MHQFPTYSTEDGQKVSTGTGMRIVWQEGPFGPENPYGPNGAMPELPVRALLDRIKDLNGTLPCSQNDQIIGHLNAVLTLIDERTSERNARGVLGSRNA